MSNNIIVAGPPQNDRQGDGAEDESAARQPAQHAARGAAHEQTETSEHTQVSNDLNQSERANRNTRESISCPRK